MTETGREELAAGAGAEAARLAALVETLGQAVRQAEGEALLVEGWPPARLELLRAGLRRPRFADVGGLRAELDQVEAELDAVQALCRRLAQTG